MAAVAAEEDDRVRLLENDLQANVEASANAETSPSTTPSTIEPPPRRWASWWLRWRALVLCLLSHTLFGLYPVLARKLTLPPPLLPAMDILFLGAAIVLVLAFPVALRQGGLKVFRQRTLWMFAAVTAVRSVTNIFAFKFALAMFVQLLGLTTPFFVAVLQRVVLKEPVPPRFYSSLIFTLVGTVLMLSSNLFTLDFHQFVEGTNLLGMGLALISAFFLALYMILVRIAFREKLPLSLTLTMQVLSMTVVPLLLLPTEGNVAAGFERWTTLDASEWATFFTISLGVYALGNIFAYLVLDYGGAAYNASLMGLRLVVTVVAGAAILGETFESAWQGVGMGIVILGLAYFALGARNAPPLVQASAGPPALALTTTTTELALEMQPVQDKPGDVDGSGNEDSDEHGGPGSRPGETGSRAGPEDRVDTDSNARVEAVDRVAPVESHARIEARGGVALVGGVGPTETHAPTLEGLGHSIDEGIRR